MIDSIYIGMSGLEGYQRGLRVIANNTANLNTPGFKSSSLNFSDTFYANGGSGRQSSQLGYGLNTVGTSLSFKPGEFRQTGNNLDLSIDGTGLFRLKDKSGNITYTRDGQFQFDKDGILVNKNGLEVMGIDANGNEGPISIASANTMVGKASASLKFSGNLLLGAATPQTVSGVTVVDAGGATHTLSVRFTDTSATTPGSWSAELMDGTTVIGTGQLIFQNGVPTAATSSLSMTYTPAGQPAIPLTLDFSNNVTSLADASLSSLTFKSTDGFAAGNLSSTAFDATGTLIMTYANGQTVKGSKLALGRFDTTDALESVGDNQFRSTDDSAWHVGVAGGVFGSVKSGYVEISNVDLSQEFSDLVIMQRGYQASSQIVSTANDMLQELFAMKK